MTFGQATTEAVRVAPLHVLILPGVLPPTLNQLMRGKIQDRIRLGKSFRNILIARSLQQRIPIATGKRRVTIEVCYAKGQRSADPDAFYKSIGDSLVKAKLLKGDSRHWVEWGRVDYKRGELQHTTIYLEDIIG